jgi:hypothetical protein
MEKITRRAKEFDEIEIILKDWDGADARPVLYTTTHGAFDLRVYHRGEKRTLCVLCVETRFICAKSGWGNAKIRITRGEGDLLELVDPEASFRVICGHMRVSEHNEFHWFIRSPYDEPPKRPTEDVPSGS